MNYNEAIDKLLQAGLENIKKTPELKQLMYTVYSDLFLQGGRCSSCGSKDGQYFIKIAADGKKKAQKFEDVSNRTVEFVVKGNVYLPKAKVTFNFNLLTDSKTVELVNKGWLPKHLIKTIPSGYEWDNNKLVEVKMSDDEELRQLVDICKAAHADEDKPNFREKYKNIANSDLFKKTYENKSVEERIKELVSEEKSSKEIANILNEEGYDNKGKRWSYQAVNMVKKTL